ncbi:MAG: ABC transporter substrate-binding protein [Hyphomicrobiales bacterium]|uniref:ABC transporter substrate-binding protein n=1 Tax=Rhabdaerophilum calidifontis TaxID=2604328 RepID=UPI00123A3E08|nr:ABC transporter substrate-binding protein [Rhabdaerophilum calidifontis]MCA1952835.1 ABC transporter substrate-binding protein [Hyphomicrobiales bacterium]MCA1999446.1 ABC transporter substrate-binding protein [Hyphomicrobiales bacterium]
MSIRRHWLAALAAFALSGVSAEAVTLRYANQGDLKSLDPYTLNETTANAHLGHVYEGLTSRGKDLRIGPGLAERWEVLDGAKRWVFHLRKGVKFHNGEDFTADDVIFSADRVRATGSNFQTRVPKGAKFTKIDDHTVEVLLESPNPILNAQWDTWYIMSKKWAEANNAAAPTPASATTPSHASLNTNGTGPFRIESHQPGVKTVFKVNPAWWGKKEHNLDEIIFTPIPNDATRVAALLSGEVDVIEPVPVQDIPRVNSSANAKVLAGPELRTIFLGYDQTRDELLESNVKGKNPFKDVRVRQAFNMAIDKAAIQRSVMRGLSTPSALMIAPSLFTHSKDFASPKFDPEGAKKLLAEAGYPNGFEVGMDCPNDRYVNDGPICQSIVGMLARIGVKVNLNAQPKAQYFAKVLKAGGYKTSFYLLGWTPGTFDSHNVLHDIHGCRAEGSPRGESNLGGYCNKEVDALTDRILVEADPAKRDALIKQAFEITTKEFAYVPLHQQALSWGVNLNVTLSQRADNSVLLYWATKK